MFYASTRIAAAARQSGRLLHLGLGANGSINQSSIYLLRGGMETARFGKCGNVVNAAFTIRTKKAVRRMGLAGLPSTANGGSSRSLPHEDVHSMSSQALLKAHVSAVQEVVDDVRPLDLVHLSRQTLGDRSLENELLSLFDRQAQHLSAQLEALAGSAERGLRRDLAHTIKGSARAVGALKVAMRAQDYENLVVSASEPSIAVVCTELSEAVAEVRSAIAGLLADR